MSTSKLNDILEEFERRLGNEAEPEILTLTEKMGFVSQRTRFNKRLAVADTSNYKVIGFNDIAFNPYLLWAGAVAQNTGWDKAIISPLYPTFRVRDGCHPRFANHLLCGGFLRSHFDSISFGSVQRKRRASVRDFLDLPIPRVPSFAEQERIVKLLDEADELRRLRTQAHRRTAEFIPALFYKMFGDPVKNPKGWRVQPVSSFVSKFLGGRSVNSSGGSETNCRFRVLKISAVTRGDFRPEESKPVPEEYEPPASHFVQKGDLLFSRANTTELVAATSYVFETPQNLLLPDKLWRFVWKAPRSVEPLFVWWLFQAASVRRELGKRATGTGGSMKNISQPKVMSLEVPVPPLPLQQEFARRVREIREMESAQAQSRIRLDQLFASLLDNAFSGNL